MVHFSCYFCFGVFICCLFLHAIFSSSILFLLLFNIFLFSSDIYHQVGPLCILLVLIVLITSCQSKSSNNMESFIVTSCQSLVLITSCQSKSSNSRESFIAPSCQSARETQPRPHDDYRFFDNLIVAFSATIRFIKKAGNCPGIEVA